MAKKLPHAGASGMAAMTLVRALPDGRCFWPENPILINDFTVPLPDVAIVRGTPEDYTRRGSVPNAEEIGLVVEITEASLRKNLTTTLQIYACAGLPVYWIVSLVARRVEVYSEFRVEEGEVARFTSIAMFEGDQGVPLVLAGHEVARIAARALMPEEPAGP